MEGLWISVVPSPRFMEAHFISGVVKDLSVAKQFQIEKGRSAEHFTPFVKLSAVWLFAGGSLTKVFMYLIDKSTTVSRRRDRSAENVAEWDDPTIELLGRIVILPDLCAV